MIAIGLVATTGTADDERPPSCAVSSFRGAAQPGGTEAAMRVVNDGTPCPIRLYISPERRTPTDRIEITEPPGSGTIALSQPNVAAYLPRPGFSGIDHFALRGAGGGSASALVTLNVRVTVTVIGKTDGPSPR